MKLPQVGGRYRVIEVLGEGGTGAVYRARDLLEERDVALKVFPAELAPPGFSVCGSEGGAADGLGTDGAAGLLAGAEYRLLASHAHPNIVRVHDYGVTEDGEPFFAMELVRGPDILRFSRDLVAASGRCPADEPRVEDAVRQLLDALDALHRWGILYLDLKPANILVAPGGDTGGRDVLKLIDFGLARAVRGSSRAAGEASGAVRGSSGMVGGTAEYLAPERIRGEDPGPRSDLYSLGVVLWEILAGEPPFVGETPGEVLRAHLETPPPRPERLPDRYRDVVLRLLEKDPARRIASAWEVRLELFGEPKSPSEAWPPFEVAFVGRVDVLRRLGALVPPRPADDEAAAVLLRGEHGVGTTRVLREMLWRLEIEGRDACLESPAAGPSRPGALLARILRRIALEGESAAAECLRELDGLLALGGTAGLGGLPGPEGAVARSGDAAELESRRERILVGFTRAVLARAARRPWTILIDDVESADTLTRDGLIGLLRAVETRGAPGLLVCLAGRDEEGTTPKGLTECERSTRGFRSVETLPLGPLDAPAVEAYLRQVLGAGAFPDELAGTLVSETGGNISFIEEYLRLLVISGRIRREGMRWRVLPGPAFEVPPSVEDAVSRRIAGVRGPACNVLRVAAVLARPFLAGEMREIIASRAVDEAVDSLAREDILRRDGPRLALASAALARVAYASMDDATRRRLHGAVAGWILESGEEADGIEEVAHHLYLSEEPRRALEHLVRAGERARRTGALREALLHLSRALDLEDDAAARFGLLLSRQEVLGHLGRTAEQEGDIGLLRDIADRLGDPAKGREATLRRALYLDSVGRKRDALETLQRAAEDPGLQPPETARLLSRIGMIRILLGEIDLGLEALRDAADGARREGDRRLEGECAQLTGIGLYRKAEYDRALADLNRALVLFREEGAPHRVGAIESNVGLIHLDRGNLEAAEESFRSSLRTFRRIGLRRGEAVNLLNLGLVDAERGRYDRALESIAESVRLRRELGDRRAEGADLGNLAEIWMRAGFHERAAPLLEEALRIARELENRQSESANECRLGRVALVRGSPEEAISRLERGLELAKACGMPSQEAVARSGLARTRLELGDVQGARREAQAALELTIEGGNPGRAASARALLAAVCRRAGDLAEADRLSREAVEDLGRRPAWLAEAHEVWFERHLVLEALLTEGGRSQGGRLDAESEAALRRAWVLLRERADAFEDRSLREGFLTQVPLHREIERLHEILQTRVRREASARERSFHEIAKSLGSIAEVEPLLDRLLALAIETTHAEKGLIALKDPEESFTIRAARGMAAESVEDAAHICRSAIADVARGGGPILATDAGSDDRFRERRSIIDFHIRTLMCVPMVVRDEIVGAVYVDGRGAQSFAPEDLDYLVSFSQLAAIAVDNARLLERLRAENLYLRREVETRNRLESIVGQSAAMERLAHLVEKVAKTPVSVLISGETGTGKELVARAIHGLSERKSHPFVAIDCGALPENLLESELFGHRRGSFSGAIHDRVGLFEEATGGTLFLDEVTNMPLDLQAKLLRVLQEGEIRRVGENQTRKVDVRVIGASNVDVSSAVAEGRFREDLFYRLNVIAVEVPPLRERREDIPLLVQHFLQRSRERMGKAAEGFTEEAMAVLVAAPWRGNVRELENFVEKAVVLCEEPRIDGGFVLSIIPPADRPPAGSGGGPGAGSGGGGEDQRRVVVPAGGAAPGSRGEPPGSTAAPPAAAPPADIPVPAAIEIASLEDFDRMWLDAEREYLRRLVEGAGGNLAEAARRARVRNRNTLVSRLKKHGIGRGEG